jgi:hypothetical protein
LLGGAIFGLAACQSGPPTPPVPQVDAATGETIIEGGDIAIVGQQVAHALMDLPEIASAQNPPLVQFEGVTSAVNGPVDTTPYTNLLRDRLLLITREKLRFVERQLPPLTSHKIKHNKDLPPPMAVDTDADYQVMAELRGNYDADTYLVQVRFVNLHSDTTLFSGLYRIRKEMPDAANGATTIETSPVEPTDPNAPVQAPQPVPPAPMPDEGGGTIQ